MAIVRPATVDDAPRIAEIHVRTWQIAYRGMVPDSILDNMNLKDREGRWREGLSKQAELGQSIFVVEHEGVLAGWILVGPSRDTDVELGEVFELCALYLHPDYWDKGYGYLLTTHAHDWVKKQQQWKCITLWVIEPNARARRFYERLGYRPDGGTKMWEKEGCSIPELRYRMVL